MLVPTVLQAQILAALQSAAANKTAPLAVAQAQLAADLAIAIDSYIRTITVVIPPGQIVATAGTPAAQTGATTLPSPPAIIS